MYKGLVQRRLETVLLASPFFRKDVKILKDVQRRATKMVSELHELPYPTRQCKLNSQLWFKEEDGMMPFWFINLLIQRHILIFFLLCLRTLVQGDITYSSPGISPQSGNGTHFLTNRVANLQNKLLPDTIATKSTNSFKNHLDNEWSTKEWKYNWESNQQHQTTSQVYIFNYVSCIINSEVSTRKNP